MFSEFFYRKVSRKKVFFGIPCAIIVGFLLGWALWYYEKDPSPVINSVTVILTFITTIIILFTLFEMKQQRKAVYLPSLVFENLHFIIDWDIEKKDPNEFEFRDKPQKEKSQNDPFFPKIKVYNIGFGSAKKIKINYSFDYKRFREQFELLINNEKLLWSLDFSDKYVKMESDDYSAQFSILDEEIQINFILPSNIQYEPNFISLPNFFSIAYPRILYVAFLFEQTYKEQNLRLLKDFPEVQMKLSYQDIGNNMYEKNYSIKFFNYFYQGSNNFLKQVGIRAEIFEIELNN